jgi:cytochrome c553
MSMQVKALGLTDEDMVKLGQYFSAQQGLQTLNVK